MSNLLEWRLTMNMDEVKNTAANLAHLVRTMIDGEYAANMSFEDLIRQLNEVAGEVESTRGLNISNAERMSAMQSLAWELQAGSLQMAA